MNITGFSPLNFPQLVRNIDYDNLTLDTVTVNNTVTIPLNSLTIGNTSGLATALNTHTTTDTNHNSRLLTQESTTDSHEIDINTVQAEVVTLQNNDVVQDTNIATNTSDITTLQSNDLTHDYNINTNTNDISTLQSVEVSQNADIVSLQNLTAIHVNNIALNSTIGSINDGKIGVLETNDVIQDSNILTNTNDITALQTNDSTQDSDINLNTSSINTLQSFFATLNGSVVSNTNDITTLQTNDTTQDSNISTNANSITALQTTVVSLNDDIQTNKTDILTKQDTLTSATSINLNMLSIGNVSGFLQNGSIYAENKIEANFMHVTGGALLLSDSTNSDNLDIYFSHSPHTSDGFNTNIMQGVTFYSGTYENMNLENVIGIKNDSVIANRYVDIVSKTNIKNELNVYSLNLLKTTNPSIKLIDIDDTGLMILNNQGGIETIKLDNAFGNITVSGNLDAQYGTITGNTITGNISGNLLAGTDITLSESNGITTINSTGGGGSSLTAGSNIDITNDVISADLTSKQDTLTSTSNISVNDIIASGSMTVDENIKSFDRAVIGSCGHTGGAFAYKNFMTTSNYALVQQPDGSTFLNAVSNKNINFRIGNTQRMILKGNGFVGIGTDNPQAPLHVAGYNNGTITQHNTNGGYLLVWSGLPKQNWNSINANIALYVPGNVVTNAVFVGYNITFASDSRIKTNIQDIDDGHALSLLRGLRPKTYDYIDKTRGTSTVIGFIAQDIETDLPDAHEYSQKSIPNFYQTGQLSNMVYDEDKKLVSATISYEMDVILESDPSGDLFTTLDIRTISSNTTDNKVIIESIDEINKTIQITGHIENIPDTNIVWLYGQYVTDFHTIKKDYIYTVAVSALQEIDRQLQTEKAKTASLESQLANMLIRLDNAGIP